MNYALTLGVQQVTCQNFQAGRNDRKVIAYVIHKPEDNLAALIPYLQDPANQVSYNYVIALDGRVICLVQPEDTAWANGGASNPIWTGIIPGVDPNLYTVSIALEGYAAQPSTREQYIALSYLLADLDATYNNGLNNQTVVFHREITDQKTCPGYFIDKFYVIQAATYAADLYNTTGLQTQGNATSSA